MAEVQAMNKEECGDSIKTMCKAYITRLIRLMRNEFPNHADIGLGYEIRLLFDAYPEDGPSLKS